MHRPLVPRIHAKSTETQENAAKIVFVDLNGWQPRPKTPCPANKRLPRSCEFTLTRMHIYEARLRSVLQSLPRRRDSRLRRGWRRDSKRANMRAISKSGRSQVFSNTPKNTTKYTPYLCFISPGAPLTITSPALVSQSQ